MKQIRVLIADDNLLAREGLHRIIESDNDIECIGVAHDGEQAVQMAKELLPDVAIIDVAMPKMNGIEATKLIKGSCPDVAVLIVSAYKYDKFVASCLEAGADGYMLKSDMLNQRLANAIRSVNSGEHIFDQEASEVMRKLAGAGTRKTTQSKVLGQRETEIINLVARGMSNKEIANHLCISEQTVGTHLVHVFRKLGVSSRTEAALYAIKHGLVDLNDHEFSLH